MDIVVWSWSPYFTSASLQPLLWSYIDFGVAVANTRRRLLFFVMVLAGSAAAPVDQRALA
jgi:hypothetical protein